MPRYARKDITSKFIHLMVQGINKEYIYKDEVEIKTYLKYLREKIQNKDLKIVSYCMMNNHAHFLIYYNDINNVSKLMSQVNTKYARFYNNKNSRCGIVFRNRYKSEEILTHSHLITCIKYIHNNPVKAGMCEKPEDYRYSSYNEYKNKKCILLDWHFIQEISNKFDISIDNILKNEFEMCKFVDIDEKIDNLELCKSIIFRFMKENELNSLDEFKDNKKFLKEISSILYFDYKFTKVDIAKVLNINRNKIGKVLQC